MKYRVESHFKQKNTDGIKVIFVQLQKVENLIKRIGMLFSANTQTFIFLEESNIAKKVLQNIHGVINLNENEFDEKWIIWKNKKERVYYHQDYTLKQTQKLSSIKNLYDLAGESKKKVFNKKGLIRFINAIAELDGNFCHFYAEFITHDKHIGETAVHNALNIDFDEPSIMIGGWEDADDLKISTSLQFEEEENCVVIRTFQDEKLLHVGAWTNFYIYFVGSSQAIDSKWRPVNISGPGLDEDDFDF